MRLVPGTGIQAIKFYREQNPDSSIREAKDFVDGFCSRRGLTNMHRWERLTFMDIDNFMMQAKEVGRNKRYLEIVEMIQSFNRDFGTSYHIDE